MHPELISLLPKTDWTRRGFVCTTLASGFALAVQPVSAETITTDSEGLTAGEVKIPVKDGEIPAYRAMPAKGESFPTVLVVQEIFGVHEHIKDICRRLAKEGYMAIAPELYARQGDVSKLAISEIMPIVAKVSDAMIGLEVPNLTGGVAKMLPNHHLTKPVLIGEVRADGQFDVVWQTDGLVAGDAWSDYLEGSKDLTSDWVEKKCGNFNTKTGKCGGQS